MGKIPDASGLINSRPAIRPMTGSRAATMEPIPAMDGGASGTLAFAKSLGGAAGDIGTAQIREQDHRDDLQVENAFNGLREKQLDLTLGDENGFAKLKGGDAIKRPILNEWGTKFDEAAKQIGEGLDNERQKERFNARVGVARGSYVGDIMRHVNHEQGVFAEAVFKGTIDTETRSAMANWNDPTSIGLSYTRIDDAVTKEISRRGWKADDPQAQALAMHATSGMHAAVIDQALQSQDPEYAQTYFEAVKNSMDPDAVKAIGPRVANGVQKQLASGYQSEYIDVNDDPKQLAVLEKKVSGDMVLDEDRKNALLGRIQSRQEILTLRAQHEEDKREKLLQSKINGVNKLTLSGFEPTAEQILPLLSEAKGTALEGEVKQMIATANATSVFRRSAPQQQEATITALEAQARSDPTKFDVTVIDRLKRIYTNQQEQIKNDPTTFAVRQGLVKSEDISAQPLDLTAPEKLTDQLAARFSLARAMSTRYQAPNKPLTKEETDVLVDVLRKLPVAEKSAYLGKLATAAGQDFDGYKAMMAQIAPDDPVTAHAGIMAGRGRFSNDAGIQSEPGMATNVSQMILRGQAILHPNRREDGNPEKGKLWPMPKEEDFAKVFQSYERDAFAGREQARNGFLQTSKAIYASKTVEAGDSSGIIDNARWEDSMKLATGGIERWNGKSIVMPWGFQRGQFKNELYRRIDDAIDSGQVPAEMRGKLRDMPLESIGDGRYVFRSGDGVMTYSPSGGKPQIKNADGTVSTERTITIEADGKHFNIPTIVGGKQLTNDAAIKAWKAGTNQAVGEFATAAEAEGAARERTARLSEELRPRPILIDFNRSTAFRPSGYGKTPEENASPFPIELSGESAFQKEGRRRENLAVRAEAARAEADRKRRNLDPGMQNP